jgi:hypothetical protein
MKKNKIINTTMTLATKIEKTCKLCIKTVRKKSKEGQKEPKT